LFRALLVGLGSAGYSIDLKTKENILRSHFKCLRKKIKFFSKVYLLDQKKIKIKPLNKKFFPCDKISQINENQMDLVIIATNTNNHLKILKLLIRSFKIKFLLIEKPFCKNLNEALEAKKIIEKNKINLIINYQRFYEKSLVSYFKNYHKKVLDFNCISYYSGSFLNNASHFITLFTHWFGPVMDIQTIEKKKIFLLKFKKGRLFLFHSKSIRRFDFELSNKDYLLRSSYNNTKTEFLSVTKDKILNKNDKIYNYTNPKLLANNYLTCQIHIYEKIINSLKYNKKIVDFNYSLEFHKLMENFKIGENY